MPNLCANKGVCVGARPNCTMAANGTAVCYKGALAIARLSALARELQLMGPASQHSEPSWLLALDRMHTHACCGPPAVLASR
jgi:hypothetical protein